MSSETKAATPYQELEQVLEGIHTGNGPAIAKAISRLVDERVQLAEAIQFQHSAEVSASAPGI